MFPRRRKAHCESDSRLGVLLIQGPLIKLLANHGPNSRSRHIILGICRVSMFLVFVEFKRKLITCSADKLAFSQCVKSKARHPFWLARSLRKDFCAISITLHPTEGTAVGNQAVEKISNLTLWFKQLNILRIYLKSKSFERFTNTQCRDYKNYEHACIHL